MNDYCLKFADEAAGRATLYDADEMPKYPAIDIIGTIYKATGKVLKTQEGDVPEMAPVPGWHVNVRTDEEAPELEQYAVTPTTPERVWL